MRKIRFSWIVPSNSTQENAKEGQPGFCPRDRDPENPAEIAVPTPTKVKATKIAQSSYLFSGMGFLP